MTGHTWAAKQMTWGHSDILVHMCILLCFFKKRYTLICQGHECREAEAQLPGGPHTHHRTVHLARGLLFGTWRNQTNDTGVTHSSPWSSGYSWQLTPLLCTPEGEGCQPHWRPCSCHYTWKVLAQTPCTTGHAPGRELQTQHQEKILQIPSELLEQSLPCRDKLSFCFSPQTEKNQGSIHCESLKVIPTFIPN